MVDITAHRGCWEEAPENSMAAFHAALRLCVDWIELDVRRTADNRVVVFHDDDLRRLHRSESVVEMTWLELQEIDISGLNRKTDAGPVRVPCLDEVLELVGGRLRLNIELKYSATERGAGTELVDRVMELIDSRKARGYCVLTSFHHAAIRYAMKQGIAAGFALDDLACWSPESAFVSVKHELIDPSFVEMAKQAQQNVHAWTVNDAARARQLIDIGVDNIITDRAELMRHIRAA